MQREFYVLNSVSYIKLYHLNLNREERMRIECLPVEIIVCSKPPEFPHSCVADLISGIELLAHVGFPVEILFI